MKPDPRLLKTALVVTRWIGSPTSIILHTVVFVSAIIILVKGIFPFDVVILILNTAVSLEAIYLALFIQMTVNYTTESIAEVSEDIDEIQEDIDEMQEDVEEIQEDVDELQEDVEDISEEEKEDEARKAAQKNTLETIQNDLRKLMADIDRLKQERV